MDNAAHHDEAEYDPASRTLTTIDVGLNRLLALDAEMLALIADTLCRHDAAAEFRAGAERTRERIRTVLCDQARGLFANRLRSGALVRSVGPTSFYPLVCGAPSAEQAARLVAHPDDPATFGGRFVVPGTARDDPAFADNTYWRGTAARIGISLPLSPAVPVDPGDVRDVSAAALPDGLRNRSFLDALDRGCYPDDVMAVYRTHGSPLRVTGAEAAVLSKGRPDFLGVNFYAPAEVTCDPEGAPSASASSTRTPCRLATARCTRARCTTFSCACMRNTAVRARW